MVAWSVGLVDVDVINDERKNYELIIVRWGASQRAVTGSTCPRPRAVTRLLILIPPYFLRSVQYRD